MYHHMKCTDSAVSLVLSRSQYVHENTKFSLQSFSSKQILLLLHSFYICDRKPIFAHKWLHLFKQESPPSGNHKRHSDCNITCQCQQFPERGLLPSTPAEGAPIQSQYGGGRGTPGIPSSPDRGVPPSIRKGRYSHTPSGRMKVPSLLERMGVHAPSWDRGTPCQDWMGVSHPLGWGR